MIECHAYFDEAGDRGTRASSSDHLILGGFVASVADEAAILQRLESLRQEFRFPPGKVLHFSKLSHDKRVRLAEVVGTLPLAAFLVILCKRSTQKGEPIHADMIYNWLVRLTLERCSWYCRESGRRTSVTLEHSKGYHVRKMRDYVVRLQDRETSVAWQNLHVPVRFGAKTTHELLQVADCIASAAFHAFHSAYGHIEDRYLRLIAPRLWRRYGQLISYGIKLHPGIDQPGRCPTDHAWVKTL